MYATILVNCESELFILFHDFGKCYKIHKTGPSICKMNKHRIMKRHKKQDHVLLQTPTYNLSPVVL